MKKQKALSPIIATVLLIAIVLVLALIIFLWMRGFIEEVVEKEVGGVKKSVDKFCADVSFVADIKTGSIIMSNEGNIPLYGICLLYTSPSPRDLSTYRMPSSA